MIYTHFKPDLDALASAWLAWRLRGRRDEVRFVSSAWPGPVPPGDLAVDIACGVKGVVDRASGRVSSAFQLLLERPDAAPLRRPLAPLAELVEAQDATGRGVQVLAGDGVPASVSSHCLPALIEAARLSLGDDDRGLFDWARLVFEGIVSGDEKRARESALADAALWFGKVALVEGDAAAELFRRGARAVVYAAGWNVGAVRAAGESFHLGRILEPWLRGRGAAEGWFFHSAGFMACHGSRKAPATGPCAISPEEVARGLALDLERRDTAGRLAPIDLSQNS